MKIKHFHLKEVSSTNDIAKDLLPDNDIVVVTADYPEKMFTARLVSIINLKSPISK